MRARIAGVAVALLAAAGARTQDDERLREGWAVGVGVGSAYDYLGVHVEYGRRNVVLFLGTGVPLALRVSNKPGDGHYDLAAGVRWFYGPRRDGLLLSFQTTWSILGDVATDDGGRPYGEPNHLKSFGVVVGWRSVRHSGTFAEAGIGLMLFQGPPGCEGCQFYLPLPDCSVAFGFDFGPR